MRAEDYTPLKPDVFHILLVLLDGPRHGYALMTDIAESTEGEVKLLPGALYRRLQRLLDDGLITERGVCEASEAGLLSLYPERRSAVPKS